MADRLLLALIFIVALFFSQALKNVGLTDSLYRRLFQKQELSESKILVLFISLAALLSFFVPNLVAALTLLPIAKRTINEGKLDATTVALALIFGANIGGLSSITATPANAIFVVWLEAQRIEGRSGVNFFTWLSWGVPLSMVLIGEAFFVTRLAQLKRQTKDNFYRTPIKESAHSNSLQSKTKRILVALLLIFFGSSAFLSWAMMRFSQHRLSILGFAVLLGTIFIVVLFCLRFDSHNHERRALIRLRDFWDDLPKKGLLWVGITIILALIAYFIWRFTEIRASFDIRHFTIDRVELGHLLILSVLASFLTEMVSNTLIQLILFYLAKYVFSKSVQLSILTVITLSSTCAFMTPIATGVNAFIYGELKNVDEEKNLNLWRLMIFGGLMNILASLTISLIGYYWIWQ